MTQVIVEHNVPAQMRDGVTLRANVYRPAAEGRYPVLLTRLPYGKDIYPWTALFDPMRAARAGYVVIAQDTRGRFESEGPWESYIHEGPDGYDTVEWAAQLPYADGNVGMFGGSYFGFTQWAAAAEQPPHLRAIAPFISWARHEEGASWRGGAFELGLALRWLLFMEINAVQRRMAAAGKSPLELFGAIQRLAGAMDRLSSDGFHELPLAQLESLSPLGQTELLAEFTSVGPGGIPASMQVQHDRVQVPVLNWGGWYDIFNQGTIDNFLAMQKQGQPTRLLMGPWSHINYSSAVGEVEFGLAADSAAIGLVMDRTALQLRWFDHWCKGIQNGVDKEPPVRVFVTGANRWEYLPQWPPAAVQTQAWYLQPDGGLTTTASPGEAVSRYTYDPADPAPTLGGNLLMPGKFGSGVKDQRPLSARPDVLTFQGEALAEPLTIMGRVGAQLFISSSAPDTDFVVRLLDVHPDGFMQNLCDGIVRARYRHSLTEPSWLEPGEVYEVPVDLWSMAHTFQPGHRVAVQVTSSSFPRWDRNLNTAEPIGAGATWQTAEQTVHHGEGHASCLLLPKV